MLLKNYLVLTLAMIIIVSESQGASLGDDCADDTSCTAVENSMCSVDKKCVCKNTHYPYGDNCALKKNLGGACSANIECGVTNSECKEGFCACTKNYYKEKDDSTVCFLRKDFGADCKGDQCRGDFMTCPTGKCECTENGVKSGDGTTCVETKDQLDQDCEVDEQCKVNYSKCKGKDGEENQCKCQDGYVPEGKDKCLKTALVGEDCVEDAECIVSLTSCNTDQKKCKCNDDNHVGSDDKKNCVEKKNLTDTCTDTSQCLATSANSTCQGEEDSEERKCTCLDTFIVKDGKCENGVGIVAVQLGVLIPAILLAFKFNHWYFNAVNL